MIVRAAAADALVHVPRGEGELAAGAPVALAAARRSPSARADAGRLDLVRRCRRAGATETSCA